MINLEKLKLYLCVFRLNVTYIDGIQLYDHFLISMKQLKKFTFNINTQVYNGNVLVELPTNEDIQRSFIGRRYEQVSSYVHTISTNTEGKCHIYSLPYDFEYFHDLDNSFQGGRFHKVRYLKMLDLIPFEHQLFEIISQAFPFLEFLEISNMRSANEKQNSSTWITFPYLISLDLYSAPVDCAKQFLFRKNAHLPRLLYLSIKCESLRCITNNLTIDSTHFNFGTLKRLYPKQEFYFPFL